MNGSSPLRDGFDRKTKVTPERVDQAVGHRADFEPDSGTLSLTWER